MPVHRAVALGTKHRSISIAARAVHGAAASNTSHAWLQVLGAALWAVTTSLPQPLMALLAFRFVDTFEPIQPAGLGFAAGAMLYVAWVELLSEAHEACGLLPTAAASVIAGSTMWLCHEHLL